MFRPAKISVFFTLLGAVAASAAPFDAGRRKPTFQPSPAASNPAAVSVLTPSHSTQPIRRWMGAKVQRVTSVAARNIKIEVSDVPIAKPAPIALRQAPVAKAGGAR